MSISPISANSATASTQFSSTFPAASVTQDSDGDHDGSRVSSVSGGGKFAAAIGQSLAQLGVSPGQANSSSDASNAASPQDPQPALATFMQSLFAALHAQGGQQATASGGSIAGAGMNAVAGTSVAGHHHHHGGGSSKLESGLQNLIQQLSSSSGQSASDASTTGSGSSGSTLDALQQSFNNLMTADGASGNGASLSTFLQSLAQNLEGAPATGNVISTKV